MIDDGDLTVIIMIISTVLAGTVETSHTLPGIAPYGPTTYVSDVTPGIFTETTDHVVDFFYVTSVVEYYDPYGFGVVKGDGGDYDSGYSASAPRSYAPRTT